MRGPPAANSRQVRSVRQCARDYATISWENNFIILFSLSGRFAFVHPVFAFPFPQVEQITIETPELKCSALVVHMNLNIYHNNTFVALRVQEVYHLDGNHIGA